MFNSIISRCTVYYAEEDSIVSSTRAEVWNKINGLPGAMDTKYGVFIPETLGFRVISISLLISNGQFVHFIVHPAIIVVCYLIQ